MKVCAMNAFLVKKNINNQANFQRYEEYPVEYPIPAKISEFVSADVPIVTTLRFYQ